MLSLEDILSEEFGESSIREIKVLLDENEATTNIKSFLNLINIHLDRIDDEIRDFGCLNVFGLVGAFIVDSYNIIILNEGDLLKNVLGSIYQRILIKLFKRHPTKISKNIFLQNIFSTITDVCLYKKYDLIAFIEFLKLQELDFETELMNRGESTIDPDLVYERGVPGYVFRPRKSMEDSLPKILIELEICKCSDEFMKLFKEPQESLNIELNENNPNYVLTFFYRLFDGGNIGTYGGWGVYQVLQYHVSKFDSIFLKDKLANRRVDTIKQSALYEVNKAKIDSTIKKHIKCDF